MFVFSGWPQQLMDSRNVAHDEADGCKGLNLIASNYKKISATI